MVVTAGAWPSAFTILRCLLAVSVLAAGDARSQDAGAARARALVIDDVTVIDVIAGNAIPNRRVIVRGDTIADVVSASLPLSDDAGVTINGRGLYLIPGLVDHHVHLSADMVNDLERAARGGVTMVQAMAGDNRAAGNLARAVMAAEIAGPRIAYASVMAGPDFFRDPRFQSAGLGFEPGMAPWAQAVTDETDVVTAVAAARGSGAEVLKLYAMMDGDLIARLTAEAHRQGMRVVAHATVFPATPAQLVRAEVDVLTHAPYLSWQGTAAIGADDAWERRNGPYTQVDPDGPELRAVMRTMAAGGMYLEPTLWVFQRGTPDSVLIAWSETVTRTAQAAGVAILAGTDGLIDRDPRALPNVHREMAALVAAGLSPTQALRAATATPARAMGRAGTHGAVAPGFVADLILLSANPLESIAATTQIAYVILRGRLLDRSAGRGR